MGRGDGEPRAGVEPRSKTALGTLRAFTYTVTEEGGDTIIFTVEEASPHRLLAWKSSSGESARILGSARLEYWKLHDNGDEKALKLLGLVPQAVPPKRGSSYDIVAASFSREQRHLVQRRLHLLLQRVALARQIFHLLRSASSPSALAPSTTLVMRSCTVGRAAPTTSPFGLPLSSPSCAHEAADVRGLVAERGEAPELRLKALAARLHFDRASSTAPRRSCRA